MESIHRRYYNSIKSYKFIIFVFALCYVSNLSSQVNQESENSIRTFLTSDFVNLLEKARDYYDLSSNGSSLKSAMSNELNNLKFQINEKAIIEYDKANRDGDEVIISDQLLPFLINYAGREFSNPLISIECITSDNGNLEAYYYSQNVISSNKNLRKAIFRTVQEKLELRRISYAENVPVGCGANSGEIAQSESIVIDGVSDVAAHQAYLKAKSIIPRITFKEASNVNGQAIIYGFVQNHQTNGVLTDIETGEFINVSERDGFFVISKYLISTGHREISLKYQYGKKFITNRKLVFVK